MQLQKNLKVNCCWLLYACNVFLSYFNCVIFKHIPYFPQDAFQKNKNLVNHLILKLQKKKEYLYIYVFHFLKSICKSTPSPYNKQNLGFCSVDVWKISQIAWHLGDRTKMSTHSYKSRIFMYKQSNDKNAIYIMYSTIITQLDDNIQVLSSFNLR